MIALLAIIGCLCFSLCFNGSQTSTSDKVISKESHSLRSVVTRTIKGVSFGDSKDQTLEKIADQNDPYRIIEKK